VERQQSKARRRASRLDDDEAAAPFLAEVTSRRNQTRESLTGLVAQRGEWEQA